MRDVGVTNGQIPDIASFNLQKAVSGWQKFPSGLILQWTTVVSPTIDVSGNTIDITAFNWPIAFTSNVLAYTNGAATYVQAVRSVEQVTLTGGKVLVMAHSGQIAHTPVTCVFAIGY